jgi:squalene-hopene cyclase-like protein
MSTADRKSNIDPELLPASRGSATIWLDGDVLSCACPECSAPMSIRLWLMVADCWRCGTSIELTLEQEREALRLLKELEEVRAPQPSSPAPPPVTRAAPPPPPVPQRQVASPVNWMKAHLRDVEERGEVELFWRAVFKDLYAWLASLVFHLVALILLAILMVDGLDETKPTLQLTLSTRTGDLKREGGRKLPPEDEPVEFEKPGEEDRNKEAPGDKPQDPTSEEEQDKPSLDPGQRRGNDPNFPVRPAGSGTAAAVNPTMIAGRSSTARAELVHQEGGTSATEAAVARGLRWLAQHQNDDGSWSLDHFHKAGQCKGRCSHPGFNSDVAGTALALLPFLGAGQTHRQGQYKAQVESGLRWLIEQQRSNGDLPSPFRNTHMYAHGLGAIVLCEAYALTQDPLLHEPAQKAIDFIVAAQHSGGGWRYHPGERGDTSVVGWQLMALRSAQIGYLDVPAETLQGAMKYLDDAQTDSVGGRYAYMPGNRTDHVMTAEALLCRQYAGWPQNHPGLVDGVEFLLESHLPTRRDRFNMYYCYYAAQVMHHMGGSAWERWNYRVRDLLVDMQETKGHEAGSWTPRVGHDDAGGRLYQTALAICTLEVYYRHLPLYRQLAVEK